MPCIIQLRREITKKYLLWRVGKLHFDQGMTKVPPGRALQKPQDPLRKERFFHARIIDVNKPKFRRRGLCGAHKLIPIQPQISCAPDWPQPPIPLGARVLHEITR